MATVPGAASTLMITGEIVFKYPDQQADALPDVEASLRGRITGLLTLFFKDGAEKRCTLEEASARSIEIADKLPQSGRFSVSCRTRIKSPESLLGIAGKVDWTVQRVETQRFDIGDSVRRLELRVEASLKDGGSFCDLRPTVFISE